MAKTNKKQLRAAWLQVHKWIGLSLAILIIPISLTGSALVWHDWLDSRLEPQRHASYGKVMLPPSAYASGAESSLANGERISSIRFDAHGGPVVAVASNPTKLASGGRPGRTSLWLNPTNAALIDKANSDSGIVRVMHVLHGSLMVPGLGRTIVGWVGAFMFVSCLSGLWLWWPLSGSFRSGLRWKRRRSLNANLHYLLGFWVLIPLAMLSFTGAWISFPKVFGQFEKANPQMTDRSRATRAVPLETTAMTPDQAVAAARPSAAGKLVGITWPTDQKAEWRIAFDRPGGPAEIVVSDKDGAVTPPKPPQPESLARTMRRWHDGTGMGPVWQTLIFLGGIIPALLSITGIIIWLRSRGARGRNRQYRRQGEALQLAE